MLGEKNASAHPQFDDAVQAVMLGEDFAWDGDDSVPARSIPHAELGRFVKSSLFSSSNGSAQPTPSHKPLATFLTAVAEHSLRELCQCVHPAIKLLVLTAVLECSPDSTAQVFRCCSQEERATLVAAFGKTTGANSTCAWRLQGMRAAMADSGVYTDADMLPGTLKRLLSGIPTSGIYH